MRLRRLRAYLLQYSAIETLWQVFERANARAWVLSMGGNPSHYGEPDPRDAEGTNSNG